MGIHAQYWCLVSVLGHSVFMRPGDLAKIAPCCCCAYFLDVDGTLLDIMPRPEDVVADESLRRLLVRLADAAGGAVGLISGRMIADIDRIFAPLIFSAAGVHGAELRFPDGSRNSSSPDSALHNIRQLLADFVAAHNGLRFEDKGAALTIHFRQAPELGPQVLEFVHLLARNSGLAVQEGKMVAELKEAHHNKGKGIKALLAIPPFCGRKPVFIGDDLTDESGFCFVNGRGGISVRAGDDCSASEARYRLQGPAEVRAELSRLLPQE
jgi:trehalose 6-phosphate phosphatase